MQDNNNANAKDQFAVWLDKYVKSDKEQVKDTHNNLISLLKDATNSTEDKIRCIAQIKYTGEVQPITSEDYNQLIDEYIKQVSEFIVIDFSSYTLEDFKKVVSIFTSQYVVIRLYSISTKALDLYIKDIREQHTLKVLNTLTDLQNQEILKENIGYKNFIYTDLEELISKYNLNCIIDKSALLQVQQSLKKDAENLSESDRIKFLSGYNLELQDKDGDNITYNFKMLFTILVMEYQKPFTEDLINRNFNANKDYYKTRHQKLQRLEALLKQAIKKIEATEQFIKDKDNTKIKRAIIRNKIPNVQIIQLDLMKFFNNQYIINQLKAIDENAYKKDLRIEAMLLFDQDDKDLANVRFSHLILKEQDQERVQLHPIYYALLSGFIDIRDANGDTDKSIKLQDALRLISNDSKYRLPKDKKSLKAYEDIMLFAKKCKATFQIIDNTTGEVILDLQDPIPLLENYKIFNGVSKELSKRRTKSYTSYTRLKVLYIPQNNANDK